MSDSDEKISDLRVVQAKTHTLLEDLTKKVDEYISNDSQRYRDLSEFRVEASKHLVEVATIIRDLKKDVDAVVDTSIPTLQKTAAGNKATIKTHSWLIRALIGATIVAMLGGFVTSFSVCGMGDASAQNLPVVEDSDIEEPYDSETD